ncbi:MAG: hypothetical protein ACI9QL_003316 [Candidatus Omnitrophota bacterium]|jgi:hypothetical protein
MPHIHRLQILLWFLRVNLQHPICVARATFGHLPNAQNAVTDVVNGRTLLVHPNHQAHIIMTATDTFSSMQIFRGKDGGLRAPPPFNRSLFNPIGFIPADPEDLSRGIDTALRHDINRQALEHFGKATARFNPWNLNGLGAMLRALNPRNMGSDKGLELATVLVTPPAFAPAVYMHPRPIFRTGPHLLGARDLDLDFFGGHVHLHIRNFPGRFNPQRRLIKLYVIHPLTVNSGRGKNYLFPEAPIYIEQPAGWCLNQSHKSIA